MASRRRSTRLHSRQEAPSSKPDHLLSHSLSTVAERDEPDESSTTTTATYDDQPNNEPGAATASSPAVPLPRTPAAAGRVEPAFEEMHPAKAHQSTASAAFEFRFARSPPALGAEAKKIMDDLHDEALRIKAELSANRAGGGGGGGGGRNHDVSLGSPQPRRIATPKAKVGRFSGAHMAEFKKMDSIAGHPSAFRTQPGRGLKDSTKSLKRSQTAANLGDRDAPSKFSDTKNADGEGWDSHPKTPVKRVRIDEQVPSPPPVATPPSRARSILASITTPTQASLARAKSVQRLSHIPSLSPSLSKRKLQQRLTKSATTSKIATLRNPPTTSPVDRVQSIRCPAICQEKARETNLSVTTPPPPQRKKTDVNKDLPSLPATPATPHVKIDRYIGFSPIKVQASPSLQHSGMVRSKSIKKLGAVPTTSLEGVKQSPKEVKYPKLELPPPILRPHPQAQAAKSPSSPPASPPSTFQKGNPIVFGASSVKGFGSSPGQASVRHVRPSFLPGSIPGTFPDPDQENIRDVQTTPAPPRGILTKKRPRANDEDDGGDDDRGQDDHAKSSPPKRLKRSASQAVAAAAQKIDAEKSASKSRIPSPAKKKKPVLSLNRLAMLARPKSRK